MMGWDLHDWMGWDWIGLNGMGMGWDGMGWDGMGWDLTLADRQLSRSLRLASCVNRHAIALFISKKRRRFLSSTQASRVRSVAMASVVPLESRKSAAPPK